MTSKDPDPPRPTETASGPVSQGTEETDRAGRHRDDEDDNGQDGGRNRDRSGHEVAPAVKEFERSSESHYRAIYDQAAVGIAEVDLTGRFLRANERYCEIVGYPCDELLGLRFRDITHPDDPPGNLEQFARITEGRSTYTLEKRYIRKDGRTVWAHTAVSLIRDRSGRPDRVVAVVEDITERIRLEAELRRRVEELAEADRFKGELLTSLQAGEERLRLALVAGRMGTWDWDLRTGALVWSDNLVEAHGLPAGSFDGTIEGFRRLIHPEDRDRVEAAIARSIEECSGYEDEFRIARPDGSIGWMMSKGKVFTDRDGDPVRMIGVGMDVNLRKRDEERLRVSEANASLALSVAQLGTWGWDLGGGGVDADARCREICGLDPGAVLTVEDVKAAIHPDDLSRIEAAHRETLGPESDGTYAEEFRFVHADGSVRWVVSHGQVISEGEGAARRPVRMLGTVLDITERKRAEEQLQTAKEEAEAANQAKTRFLAVLSHELRTPLNPILLAASSMLDRPASAEEIRPTLEMIRQNVNLQARLIDDLLDVMRIVRGKMPLHWEITDCHRLINQAIQICRSEFSRAELRVDVDLAATHRHVNADPARLQQVFWNLIKNAVKFTPSGGTVALRAWNQVDPEEPERRIVVEISDTGIGIEPEILPGIFDPFQQGETTITRKFGGLGLGLAICKGIVEAHGGSISAGSDGRDRGTTIQIVLRALPLQEINSDAEPGRNASADRPTPPPPLRILMVEDEQATLQLLARLLRSVGHTVTTANTLASAYEAFVAGEFDLIVSDIGLPDGTGLELMRRVLALRGRIPAIALTGYGMEDDIVRSREAGFTAHMTKPIDFTKLEAMIRQVVPQRL